MKIFKRLLALALILCLAAALIPSACAEKAGNEYFKDKTWDDVIADFITSHSIKEKRIALGYRNTVTGEEHFFNGDQYMVSASLYKVPLNMYFAEKVSKGEMTMDTTIGGTKYSELQKQTIVYSSNDLAKTMWKSIGTYLKYRQTICPYMGEDAETADKMFFKNNYFTAEQMIYCLNLLYTEQDRFPGVIDNMLKAEPTNYFKYHKQEFDVAHKYGYLIDDWHFYLNDSAIVYTDDPIVIVMFSDAITSPYDALSDYCTLMCDYTQYHTKERLAEEKADAEAQREAEREQAAQEREQQRLEELKKQQELAAASPAPTPDTQGNSDTEENHSMTILILVILLAMLAAMVAVFICSRKKRINVIWALLCVIFAGGALMLCCVAQDTGILYCAPGGDPQATVTGFFDSVIAGDYNTAYSKLSEYTGLGLEKTPQDDNTALIYDALRNSYAYTLDGECVVNAMTAKQNVTLTYLDLNTLQADMKDEVNSVVEDMAKGMSMSELYDGDHNYKPEITDKAYATALKNLLKKPELYYVTTSYTLELEYKNGGWLMKSNTAMFNALVGAVG